MPDSDLYIGLMSGTSLDGVDGVLAAIPASGNMQLLDSSYLPFPATLRAQLMVLQQPGADDIHEEACAVQDLAAVYAACVQDLLCQQDLLPSAIRAIAVHGQTIRHRPESGYTRQSNHPSLLAELTGIDVIADFRSRDIAAGGQGAPLVPAFHRAIFAAPGECRVVANIGGISNISILHADGFTTGFDTGPGNVLMDAWISQQRDLAFDENGDWAAQGQVQQSLLLDLLNEPFLALSPPKSTGRDLFRPYWLAQKLQRHAHLAAADVQASLCAYTARSLADAILGHAPQVKQVFVCGGGAFNRCLMQMLQDEFLRAGKAITLASTQALGVAPQHVEALAFAWLGQRFTLRLPGNLPEVTGAKGLRILGALYPA